MSWLTQSFQEHTLAWLLISSFVGGLIGASLRFVFEDVLRPMLGWQRETKRVVRRYSAPLVRSADSLERRINIIVRNQAQQWFETDEYFRISTLYQFGAFFGWVRIVEQRFGFLPFETSRRGAEFNRRLNGVFRALSSHAYFRSLKDPERVEASAVPRLMLTAIGEAMTAPGEEGTIIGFTEFVAAYANDSRFRRWFLELDTFLRGAGPADPLRWDRLIAAAANLRALIRFLDPKGHMSGTRYLSNLDQLANAEVRKQLEHEFPKLIRKRG